MQAFEFAKALLFDLRRQKKALLAAKGDIEADKKKPIRLQVIFDKVAHSDDEKPLKTVTVTLTICADKLKINKDYELDIPSNVDLSDESKIDTWLEAVFEFTATAHGMSVRKADKPGENSVNTKVFFNPDQWAINWVTTQGNLSKIPVEIAGAQLDIQEKRALEGWTDSVARWDDNPDNVESVEKTFKGTRQAAVTSELIYQLLVLNGYREENIMDTIEAGEAEEGFYLKMPKDYLNAIRAGEMYIGKL